MHREILLLILALATSSAAAYISVVTGASGFVGKHVVYSLLSSAQARDGDDPKGQQDVIVCLVRPEKVEYEESYWNAHLTDMQKSACVKVQPYDMLDDGETLHDALEEAIKVGSSQTKVNVYHIASVFGPTPDPIQTAEENVQSAEVVVRTLDKLRRNHNTKPRLIVTSSMAAVRATDQTPLNGKYYTHRDWNTLSTLLSENWGACYQWSKKESERRAWELVQECNEKYANEEGAQDREIEMVALCPSFVFGPPPPLPTKLKGASAEGAGSSSYSVTLIDQWLRGSSSVQSRLCIDVRDCAAAHVAAGALSSLPEDRADRRWILSTEERLSSELTAQALKRGVEEAQKSQSGSRDIDMSKITCDTQFTGGAIKIGDREVEASERLKRDLGVVCRPVEETMEDMARALLFRETF